MTSPHPRRPALRLLLAAALSIALAGCQVDLYTRVTEADANEMLGALLAAGVDAQKETPDGGKTWNIQVEKSQTVRALEVLRDKALPHERRPTLGDLFKRDGMISSPTEERVRFLYGQEQELAETISRIDGVIVARVHVVLPNNDPLSTVTKPSSASVFVKYRRGTDIQALVPDIKNLVTHAVEGLEYSEVTVTPVAAADSSSASPRARAETAPATARSPWLVPGLALGGLALLLGAGGAALAWRKGWRPRAGAPAEGALPLVTPQLEGEHASAR